MRCRFVIGLVLAGFAGGSCSSESKESGLASTRQALTDLERVLTFDRVSQSAGDSDWRIVSGFGVLNQAAQHTHGAASLGLTGTEYVQVDSIALAALTASSAATIDILVPGDGSPIPWGGFQLFFDRPSQSAWNVALPYQSIQGRPTGSFQTITTPLDAAAIEKLTAPGAADLVLRLAVSTPSTSPATLIDRLSFDSTGGTSGAGGSSGTGGTGQSGSAGQSGASGNGGATGEGGGAGASGTDGSGGSAGTESGSGGASAGSAGAPTEPEDGSVATFSYTLPVGLSRSDIALAATGQSLLIEDRVSVVEDSGDFASVSAAQATELSRLGVDANVQDFWSHAIGDPPVNPTLDLRNRAHAHGAVRSSGTVSQQPDSVISFGLTENANLEPLRVVAWDVLFPATHGGPIHLEPNQSLPLPPGAYGSLTVKSGAHLALTGSVTFEGPITIEPGGVINIDNAADAVFIYGRSDFTFRGTLTKSAPHANVLFGIAGSNEVFIESFFDATIIAPSARITFGTTALGHRGQAFAKGILVGPDVLYRHEPFDSCSSKQCGDAPDDGIGGLCPGLCGNGQPGCTSDLDCPQGSVCGFGVGERFGFSAGSNVCWPVDCVSQDPAEPNCGVDPQVCGVCPACQPQCEPGSTGPDGCGGFCGECAAGEERMADGECVALSFFNEDPDDFPLPLPNLETDPAGALAGSFQVTDRGTASYSIPISVPPGRMGMQPTLSLNYSSTKTNGMLGMGWTLGGLSSITRCPSIVDREGVARPVEYGANDRFCLDGRPLVLVEGSAYGAHGAQYRTEIDAFTRITSLQSAGVAGPHSFLVEAKDGRRLFYGRTDDSSVFTREAVPAGETGLSMKRIWALSLVLDRSGNTLAIKYRNHRVAGRVVLSGGAVDANNDTGELLPDVISYGGFVPESVNRHTRFVKFHYEDRDDPRRHYVSGQAAVATQRLTRIETLLGNDIVKTYKIQYGVRQDLETRVASIAECASDHVGEKCLPPTTFEYDSLQLKPMPNFAVLSTLQDGTMVALDADGDGRDEVLGFSTDIASPGGFGWLLLRYATGPSRLQSTQVGPLSSPIDCVNRNSVIDVNRDGRDDLIDLCPQEDQRIRAFISNGSDFESQLVSDAPVLGAGRLIPGDLDGDGLRDLVHCGADPDSPGHSRIKNAFVFTISGDGTGHFSELGELQGLPPPPPPVSARHQALVTMLFAGRAFRGDCRDLIVFDANGDGREDLVHMFTPGVGIRVLEEGGWRGWGRPPPLSTSPIPAVHSYQLVDVNGDGLKDIVFRDIGLPGFKPGDTQVPLGGVLSINTGRGFRETRVEGVVRPSDLRVFWRGEPMDYDGDGREDLIHSGGVLRFPEAGGVIAEYIPFASSITGASEVGIAADVNGDGSRDVIPSYTSLSSVGLLSNQARAGLLKRVTDGVGKRIEIRYQAGQDQDEFGDPPQSERTYDGRCTATAPGQGSTSSTTCLRRVAPLVSAHTESQLRFSGGSDFPVIIPGPSYTYRYRTARAGLRGRGWFGFGERFIQLDSLWQMSLVYHNTDFFLAGRLFGQHRRYINPVQANLVSTERTHDELSLYRWTPQDGDFVQFPFVQEEEHVTVDGDSNNPLTTTLVSRDVDAFGTVRFEHTDTFAGDELVTKTQMAQQVSDDPAQWLIGRVTAITTDSTRRGTTVSRRQRFTYFDDTLLLRTVERQNFGGDPDAGLPAGGPDPNRPTEYQKTTFDRDDFGNVERTCAEDSRGPLLQRCIDVGQWDTDHVFPRLITDAENLETEVQYSARFGQLLWVIDPNGIVSEQSLDAFGRVQRMTAPDAEGTIRYHSLQFAPQSVFGSPIEVRAALKIESIFKGRDPTTSVLDAFGRVVQETVPGFTGTVQTETEYDSLGRVVRSTLPHQLGDTSQGIVNYAYDELGRLSSVTAPGNQPVRYFYPTLHSVNATFANWFVHVQGEDSPVTAVVVQKPGNNLAAAIHDPYGNVVRAIQAPGLSPNGAAKTEYLLEAFDVIERVVFHPGPEPIATIITSDDLGRTTVIDDPALGEQSFGYNGFDEVVSRLDANSVLTQYFYDVKGRPRAILNSDSGETIARWVYGGIATQSSGPNERGRLIAAYRQSKPSGGDAGNWVRYNYEVPPATGPNRGRLESMDYGVGGNVDDPESGERFNIGFAYQAEVPWRLDTVQYPAQGGAFAAQYGYNAASGMVGRVASATSAGDPYWQLLETDQGFRPKRERFGNGIETLRDYYSLTNGASDCSPGFDRSCVPGVLRGITTALTEQSGSPVQNVTYQYTRNGNLARKAPPGQFASGEEYAYDGFDRLTHRFETFPGGGVLAEQFNYDLGGNILSKTGTGLYEYQDPERPYQVTRTGGAAAAGGTEYLYEDGANGNQTTRLGAGIPGGRQELDYDEFDMPWRIATGAAGSAVPTELEYDGTGARIVKRKRASAAPNSPVAELTVTIGEMYEQVTDAAGNKVHRFRVYAGGKQVAQVQRTESGGVFGPDTTVYLHDDQLGSTSAITDAAGEAEVREFRPFGEADVNFSSTGVLSGFTGHSHDPELGLVNMRGRLYDARLARFVTPDPFVTNPMNQGLNRYAYVENNPLNFTDPSGFQLVPDPGHPNQGQPQPTILPPSPPPPSPPSVAQMADCGSEGCRNLNIGPPPQPSRPPSGQTGSPSAGGPSATDAPSAAEIASSYEAANAQAYLNHGYGSAGTPGPSDHGGGYDSGFRGAPATISQAPSQPSGPSQGSWIGGHVGSSSTATAMAGGFGSSFGHWLSHADYFGSSVVQSDAALAELQGGFERGALSFIIAAYAVFGVQVSGILGSGSLAFGGAAAGQGGGSMLLYHGSDVASVNGIVSSGLNRAAAGALGGGDVFWTTQSLATARLFALANPAGGAPAVLGVRVPTNVFNGLLSSGVVSLDRSGAYVVNNWTAFNAVAHFFKAE